MTGKQHFEQLYEIRVYFFSLSLIIVRYFFEIFDGKRFVFWTFILQLSKPVKLLIQTSLKLTRFQVIKIQAPALIIARVTTNEDESSQCFIMTMKYVKKKFSEIGIKQTTTYENCKQNVSITWNLGSWLLIYNRHQRPSFAKTVWKKMTTIHPATIDFF